MCIYGVTRGHAVGNRFDPSSRARGDLHPWAAWLLLEHLRRQSGLAARQSGGMLALAMSAGLVAFAHGAEVYYVCNMTSLRRFSCCCGRD